MNPLKLSRLLRLVFAIVFQYIASRTWLDLNNQQFLHYFPDETPLGLLMWSYVVQVFRFHFQSISFYIQSIYLAALFLLIPLKHSETVSFLIHSHVDFGKHIHDLHVRSHFNLSHSPPPQLLALFLSQQRIRLHHRHSPRVSFLRIPRQSHRLCPFSLLFRSFATLSRISSVSDESLNPWKRRFGDRLPRNCRMTTTVSFVVSQTRRNHRVFCRAGMCFTRVV